MTKATGFRHKRFGARHVARRTRRGAVLVIVAVALVGLVGLAAMAVDFARMYAFKAQLKVLTDAVSIGAMEQWMNGKSLTAATTGALALQENNRIEGNHRADNTTVEFGYWIASSTGGEFVPDASNPTVTSAMIRAARARAQYTTPWSLGRVFGSTTRTLTEESVAAAGSRGLASCLKPIVLPYSAILRSINIATTNLAYQLTPDDVNKLLANTTGFTYTLGDGLNANEPGSFNFIDLELALGNLSNANEEIQITLQPTCLSMRPYAIGDWLQSVPGARQNSSFAVRGLNNLCLNQPSGNANSGTCVNGGAPVEIAVYDNTTVTDAPGGGQNIQYQIRYIGAMKLLSFNFQGSNKDIDAVVTSFPTSLGGGFVPRAGPVTVPAIVK